MSKRSHLTPDERQADRAIRLLNGLNTPRHGNKDDGKFHSVGSIRNARLAFKHCSAFCREHGFKQESFKSLTTDTAGKFLEHRASQIQQKQLNIERNALNKHLSQVHGKKIELPFQKSFRAPPKIVNRSYSHDQVKRLIAVAKNEGKHDLAGSIALAYTAGLRVEELHTIMPPGVGEASTHRTWSDKIYTAREAWIPAIVDGKGGLKREVRYTNEIRNYLVTRLRDTPIEVLDKPRGTIYESHYKLISGHKFSDQFGDLSRKIFGWSNGPHGLRHSFAQRRIIELKNHFLHDDARKILAQELGHFDTSNLIYYGV